jgi:hypothetical protein
MTEDAKTYVEFVGGRLDGMRAVVKQPPSTRPPTMHEYVRTEDKNEEFYVYRLGAESL